MSDKKKHIKIRRNVQEFVDYDYKGKLTKEESIWLDNFTNEYYSNAHSKEDSIHRKELGDKYDVDYVDGEFDAYGRPMTLKQVMFRDTNAKNVDSFGISNSVDKVDDITEMYSLASVKSEIETFHKLRETGDIKSSFKYLEDEELLETTEELLDIISDSILALDNLTHDNVKEYLRTLAINSMEITLEIKKRGISKSKYRNTEKGE